MKKISLIDCTIVLMVIATIFPYWGYTFKFIDSVAFVLVIIFSTMKKSNQTIASFWGLILLTPALHNGVKWQTTNLPDFFMFDPFHSDLGPYLIILLMGIAAWVLGKMMRWNWGLTLKLWRMLRKK